MHTLRDASPLPAAIALSKLSCDVSQCSRCSSVASVEVVDEAVRHVFLDGTRLVQGRLLLQVGDRDRLVAVRAGSAGADADGEGVAVGAALLTEEPGVALGAGVDGPVPV